MQPYFPDHPTLERWPLVQDQQENTADRAGGTRSFTGGDTRHTEDEKAIWKKGLL